MPLIFVEPVTARVVYANAAADRMAGGSLARPANAAACARLYDMRDLDGRVLPVDENPLVRAARGERLSDVQVRWHFPAGEKAVAMHSLRLAAVHGHPETVLIAFDDITALKAVQTALERAVRVRQDFLSIAGHELKTPLTALLLVQHALDRTLSQEADAKVAGRWRSLLRQTRRLGMLVDQLLDVSRLSAGKLILEEEPLDLVDVVRDVVTHFPRETAPILVEAPAPVPGRWDPLRLEQVITNLVSNAVKYGEGRPVTVRIESDGGTAILGVRDQGIGIAPGALTRIFDRFERATPVRNATGLGLGLWIVRQIVEAMGGTVGVESKLGKGSTFTVRLPRAD
jgi:signal transduction histidine kinase